MTEQQTKPALPRGAAATSESRDSIVTLLCDELEDGLSISCACDVIGISRSWYARWRKKAEQGDDEAIVLIRRLKAARVRGMKKHTEPIKRSAAEGDWRASAWLAEKLYPDLLSEVERIDYDEPGEQQDGKPDGWSAPSRIMHSVQFAVESGLVTIDQLIAMAPKGQRPSIEQPTVDPLERIRDAVVGALADGPREQTELRDVVCALTSCSLEELEQACDGLDLEQLASPGSKTMVRLANPPDRTRTTPNVVSPEAEPTNGAESLEMPATDGFQDGEGGNEWQA